MRLDSWKAIAEYLQRDLATVRRWEKAGLPVHRVPGAGRRSVFAYKHEIDEWLASSRLTNGNGAAQTTPGVVSTILVETTPGVVVGPPPRPLWRRWSAATLLVAVGAFAGWYWSGLRLSGSDFRVKATNQGVRAVDAAGQEVWHHSFPTALNTFPISEDGVITAGRHPAVYVATMHSIEPSGTGHSGQLLEFSMRGHLDRTFEFTDTVAMSGKPFGPPWALTDFDIHERDGRRRIAVSAHHYIWSASLVTILDDDWKRVADFTHDGWIESVNWIGPDRLLLGGFSQSEDAGLVALLDVSTPVIRPIRMVALPRSEVNRVGGSPFNRAAVQLMSDRLLARTVEVPANAFGIDAIYELDLSLKVQQASFSSRYWEIHQTLERDRKLGHSQDQCPYRDGPGHVRVWTPETGWTTEAIER